MRIVHALIHGRVLFCGHCNSCDVSADLAAMNRKRVKKLDECGDIGVQNFDVSENSTQATSSYGT